MLFPFHDDNPIRRWPWMTVLIIVINAACLLWVQQQPWRAQGEVFARYGFVPKRIAQLRDAKLVVEVDISPPQERRAAAQPKGKKEIILLPSDRGDIFFSLLTCMFLHGGWFHLLGNMWFLWLFGNNIEDRLGHFIFLFFYLFVGLLASACHWAIDRNSVVPVVGASGAVAGVLGAYAVTFPKAKVRTLIFVFIIAIVELPALFVLFAWFALQLFQGMWALQGQLDNVAWWAHIGGFLAGVLLMPILAAGAPEPGTHWEDEAEKFFKFD